MNPSLVFEKTEKGREEIAKRTHRLESRLRTLLILVDGRTDAQGLADKITHHEDPLAALDGLWKDGFIRPTSGEAFGAGAGAGAAAPATSPTSAAGPAVESPPGPDTRSLEQLRREAVGYIQRTMGPDGDALAIKLEKATTRDEFLAEARRVRDALSAFLGPKKGEAFGKAIGL